MRIAFYISGHGFGHATRSIEVINAIAAREPRAKFAVRCSVPRWLFEANVRADFDWSPVEFDLGVVERGPFDVDIETSVAKLTSVWDRREPFIAQESALLKDWRADVVLTDVSPLACEMAARAGVPSVAISNFGWDYIYRAFGARAPEAGRIAEEIAAAYSKVDLLLRLPFFDESFSFGETVDVPLVARRAAANRVATRRELGVEPDEDRRIVLLVLRHDALTREGCERLAAGGDLVLCSHPFAIEHPNLRLLDLPWQRRYLDLVAAADVAVSKPGYGIVSDCIAARTPLVALPRRDFSEYEAFQREMPKHLGVARLSEADFCAGRWEDALERALAAPWPDPPTRIDGASEVAARILDIR